MVNSVSEVHPKKRPLPNVVTEEGMTIVFRALQFEKVSSFNSVIPSGIVMLSNL